MNEKPPVWADCFLSVWVATVGIIYFGGYFAPAIGALTSNFSAAYAAMVLTSAVVLAGRYLRRSGSRAMRRK